MKHRLSPDSSRANFRGFLVLRAALITLVLAACGSGDGPCVPTPGADAVLSLFSIQEDTGFFDAPFPAEHMRRADGTVRYDLLPNPGGNLIVKLYKDQANRETSGFSRAGAVYLPFNGVINHAHLPATPADSLQQSATVFLVNVDSASSRYGERIPIYSKWQGEPTRYLPGNLLKLLPYQGIPLAPNALYAAVVLTSLGGGEGRPLAPADTIVIMRDGGVPAGAHGPVNAEAFRHLWAYCDTEGIPRQAVAAATVFRTGDFVRGMKALREAAAALPDPVPYDLSVLREHESYYIIQGKMVLPIWQDGTRPYWFGGGRIHFQDGVPVRQWDEEIRFAVSVPKQKMPVGGFPLLFYANGQGGSYTQVFDRGPTSEDSGTPGTGPALQFTHRGVACLDIEASTVGPRHPWGSYEGLAFFNFVNLVAFRDNIRQAAAEFTLLVKMARNLRIPAALVPQVDAGGRDTIGYDSSNFFFWGHSTGSSIGELVLAFEPGFRAGILSGAGVSWNYNLVMKKAPLELEPLFRFLAGSGPIDRFHPLALIFQNLCDEAEAAYYAPYWLDPVGRGRPPPNILIIMGIYDQYFPPLMVDGLIASAGVDLAGPIEHEETLNALALSGGAYLPWLPAPVNIHEKGRAVGGMAVQHETPPDVDGHYVPFYLPEVKFQYTCFLETLIRTGAPILFPPQS